MVQNRTGIMDLQNKNNILVAKQWKISNSVPMSYIIWKKDLKSTRRGLFFEYFVKGIIKYYYFGEYFVKGVIE